MFISAPTQSFVIVWPEDFIQILLSWIEILLIYNARDFQMIYAIFFLITNYLSGNQSTSLNSNFKTNM